MAPLAKKVPDPWYKRLMGVLAEWLEKQNLLSELKCQSVI